MSLRYLRARRKEGFISVIAGFSFLGILLGVATLIIVMSVMNGFRVELQSKILGFNGHVVVTPIETPLTDFAAVTQRIAAAPGVTPRLAHRRGPGARLLALQRRRRARARACAPADLCACSSIAANVKEGSLDGFDDGQGVMVGSRLAETLGLRLGDNITLTAPRGAATAFGTTPRIKSYPIVAIFTIGMSEVDSELRLHAARRRRRPISTATTTSRRSRSMSTTPTRSTTSATPSRRRPAARSR